MALCVICGERKAVVMWCDFCLKNHERRVIEGGEDPAEWAAKRARKLEHKRGKKRQDEIESHYNNLIDDMKKHRYY